MQEKVKEGRVPLPLMTCVNVKADRSARSFQGEEKLFLSKNESVLYIRLNRTCMIIKIMRYHFCSLLWCYE